MELPRKVQLTGRNTYIVSLPHEWVKKKGISKGDAVYLAENGDGTLTFSLKPAERELKTCMIEVSTDAAETSMRNVVSAYVGGAGRIILRGSGMSTVAEEARRILSGVEISEETDDELVLRIMAFDDLDCDSIIKRAFNVTQSMFNLATGMYRDGSDVLIEISRKEDEVDRLYLLLLRNLSMGRDTGRNQVLKAIAAKSIEKVSDHLEDICSSGKTAYPNALIARLLERSSRVYALAYDAFSKNELETGAFAEAKKQYLADFGRVDETLKKEKNTSRMLTLRSLCEKCNKVLRYSEDIMESGTDMVFANMEGVRRQG